LRSSAAKLLEAFDRRILRHQDGKPLARLPDRGNGLCPHIGGRRKGEGRIPDQSRVDRARAQRFEQGRGGGEFLPLDLVRDVLENAGRLRHGLRVSLLVADAQDGFSVRERRCADKKCRGEKKSDHSAASPLADCRSAISLRVSGISSRP
jgi:hypothetical protein